MKQRLIALVRTLDRRLNAAINSLDKQQQAVQARNVSLTVSGSYDMLELLRAAHYYDIASYYSNARPAQNTAYRTARKLYDRSRHLAVRILRLGYRTLRQIKG